MKRTSNITWQEEGDFLSDFLSRDRAREMPIFVGHAINLYIPQDEKQLPNPRAFSVHPKIPVTDNGQILSLGEGQMEMVKTMRCAADFAFETMGFRPDFITVAEAQDLPNMPAGFEKICLSHEIRNVTNQAFQDNECAHLPCLFDILAAIQKSSSNASHIIFTNSDIFLQPWFYATVLTYLQSGYDSLIINRRTVQDSKTSFKHSVDWLKFAEIGTRHGGMDCFIFPKIWLEKFNPTKAIVGRGAVMRSLLFNMVALAQNMLVLSHANLTYHHGDDRPWMSPTSEPARQLNKEQAAQLWLRLMKNTITRQKLVDLGELLPQYRPALPQPTLKEFFSS
jgi:hypothetical protein